MRRMGLVPLCFVIFDLEPLSLSFDFVFKSEIFKSFPCLSLSSFLTNALSVVFNATSAEDREEGFTVVKGRKNKGKKVVNQQSKNQIAGIRFNKPKSSFFRPINKTGSNQQPKVSISKPAAKGTNSTAQVSDVMDTPTSNTFTVLNLAKEYGDLNNREGSQILNVNELSLVNEEAGKVKEKDSLGSRFKEMEDASSSKDKSSTIEDEADEDEVYMPEGYSHGGGFSMDKYDLDHYDGYRACIYDLSKNAQAFCD
nr:hypothetical protein [Tanacetum cinerariifolium]